VEDGGDADADGQRPSVTDNGRVLHVQDDIMMQDSL
jgi:hypothetical protein